MANDEPPENAAKAFAEAKESAKRGDPVGMLTALATSLALDRMAQTLEKKWRSSSLDYDQAQLLVGQAVDEFYDAVRSGRAVMDVPGFIYKAAWNHAHDRWQKLRRERVTDPTVMSQAIESSEHEDPPSGPWSLPPEERRRRALAIARSQLSQLGQHNIQRVLGYLFDAIEQGREEVPHREIADTFGLSVDTVKKSIERGFQRLTKIAREKGLADEDFQLPGFVTDTDVDLDADGETLE